MTLVNKTYPGNYEYRKIDEYNNQLKYVIDVNRTRFYIPDEVNELKLVADLYTTNPIVIQTLYSSLVKLIRRNDLMELMNKNQKLDVGYEVSDD